MLRLRGEGLRLHLPTAAPANPNSLVISNPAAGIDNIAPAPASHIQAVDRSNDSGGHILVSWSLSPDDRPGYSAMPRATFQAASGISVYPSRHVSGYRIYRSEDRMEALFIGQAPAGASTYVDSLATNGVLYRYEVRPFDTAHETPASIDPGSADDLARSARAIDNTFAPIDAEGRLVQGWFNPRDATIGFDDFFLFTDHFGRVDGEINFDPLFDLNGDLRVDFADFFIFAENFGKIVANFADLETGN